MSASLRLYADTPCRPSFSNINARSRRLVVEVKYVVY
jgi:hypothetical protein